MIPRLSLKKLKALNGKPVPWSTAKRSGAPRKSNPRRKASGFARKFHSLERVEFVKSLPCAACGVVGFSENAHLTPKSEKGTGYRGGWEFIAPLCRIHGSPRGLTSCHLLFDRYRSVFDGRFPDFSSVEAARETEKLWEEFHTANQPSKEK